MVSLRRVSQFPSEKIDPSGNLVVITSGSELPHNPLNLQTTKHNDQTIEDPNKELTGALQSECQQRESAERPQEQHSSASHRAYPTNCESQRWGSRTESRP